MDVKCVLLGGRSQPQKAVHCVTAFLGSAGEGKTRRTGKKLVVSKGGGGARRELVPTKRQHETAWYCKLIVP